MKKLLVISDGHVACPYGLSADKGDSPAQQMLNRVFKKDMNRFKKPDIVVCNGDMIHGKPKGKSAVVKTADMISQAEEAAEIVARIEAGEYWIVGGTETHTASRDGEDFERVFATKLNELTGRVRKRDNGMYVHDRLFLDVEGHTFLFRHHIGGSSIPHGWATAPLRSAIWNQLNAAMGDDPLANTICFGHLHHYINIETSRQRVITLPCYSARGSRYGSRLCDGYIDVGCVHFRCHHGIAEMEKSITVVRDESGTLYKGGE